MKAIKKITAVALILMTAAATMVVFTACSDDSAVGFWIVQKVTAGEVVMNEQDAESIGLNAVGTIKLQKSGTCELNLLGEETKGKWGKAKDGTITIRALLSADSMNYLNPEYLVKAAALIGVTFDDPFTEHYEILRREVYLADKITPFR